MKKKLLFLLLICILVTACQTQEERELQKEKERVNEITKEIEKNTEVPEETKKWLIDNKAKKVLTILCLKTSNRCNKIKEEIKDIEKNITVYYVELDDLADEVKDIYKTTYSLNGYTGYLPYTFLVDNNKLLATNTSIKDIDDIRTFLKENKIVSE